MPRPRRRLRRRKSSRGLNLQPKTLQSLHGIAHLLIGALLALALREEAGPLGRGIQRILTFFAGRWALLFPVLFTISGLLHWTLPTPRWPRKRLLGLALSACAFLGLMHIGAPLEDIGTRRDELAGAIGFMISLPFILLTSRAVGIVVLSSVLLAGILLAFEPDPLRIITVLHAFRNRRKVQRAPRDVSPATDLVEQEQEPPELNIVRPAFAKSILQDQTEKVLQEQIRTRTLAQAAQVLQMKDTRYEEWTFPTYDLLEAAQSTLAINDDELKRQARLIEEKLREFEIDVTVRDAHPGPTVTQFTVQPAEGVKLSRIGSLKDDLSLALAAQSLRIEAPIPGKSLVGIEMPNAIRTTVHLKEILESSSFSQSSSSLTLPLGRDVSGDAVVANLDAMPHLLIAGATGSGKSVCMNTFLLALLFQNAPHELKFILIDPKRVELMPYDGIPHLLTPVITEAEKALQAFRWAVAEMGRRLRRFSEAKVRNIDEFNEKQTREEDMLARIVIVIDELADLMMRQFRRDTEMMITRIAQMARAVGMHLVIATQRPSVDVITGLIKANVPTRIAFRTVSAVDSRTIIDGIGAEDLLGKGDMLYMTASTPKPIRIQGIYVSTKEVERVINTVKIAGGGKITEQIGLADEATEGTEETEATDDESLAQGINLEADDDGGDDLFFEAVAVVRETNKASASLLQRRLSVGYARAAKLLDIMERKGLIGPTDGAKARKVYMEKTNVAG
ncbi:DNA translocase FtsK [Candidatus Peregrinibacteria bacterium]|nr:DNA translocase FtsK [Candidatus Peregrinibacteria bacterium]